MMSKRKKGVWAYKADFWIKPDVCTVSTTVRTTDMKIYLQKILLSRSRSSHQRCSISKDVLRNLTKFIGKHICLSPFFNKVAGLRPSTLLKKMLWHMCFPVNFVKLLRKPFLQNTSRRLLLSINLFQLI